MNVIEIVKDSDLMVEVTERSDNPFVPTRTVSFRVSKDALRRASPVLREMLAGQHWRESFESRLSLGEGSITVSHVWLRIIHEAQLTYKMPFHKVWHLIQAVDYYDLNIGLFKDWFARWYERLDLKIRKPSELLYPRWRFDHACGFARWTRTIAYADKGHLTESNPTGFYQYHLPARLIRRFTQRAYE